MENEFKYRNMALSREEVEGWPCPICTDSISDERMGELAKEIFDDLAQNFNPYKSVRDETAYLEELLGIDWMPSTDERFSDWDKVGDMRCSYIENYLLDEGAHYFEDE